MTKVYNPDLNRDNLQLLINHLEKIKPDNFDMQAWLIGPAKYADSESLNGMLQQMETTGGCGTTGCIAGHAAMLAAVFSGKKVREMHLYGVDDFYQIWKIAENWLGLDSEQAHRLFLPENRQGDTRQASIPKVLSVLKNLKDTGRVDWKTTIAKYA